MLSFFCLEKLPKLERDKIVNCILSVTSRLVTYLLMTWIICRVYIEWEKHFFTRSCMHEAKQDEIVQKSRIQWLPKYSTSANDFLNTFTAISRKVVGKSARDNPEMYCGWFWVHCSSEKFERMAREAIDLCLLMLKESNNRRFESYRARNSVLIKSHIASRDHCRVHIFSDNLSRNSCMFLFWNSSYRCYPVLFLLTRHKNEENRIFHLHTLAEKMCCEVWGYVSSKEYHRYVGKKNPVRKRNYNNKRKS